MKQMATYDMLILGQELGIQDNLFLTRRLGELAYFPLKDNLEHLPEGMALILVFPPDQLVDGSFADESIIRLGEELITGKLGDRYLLLANLAADSVKNINSVIGMRRLKVAFLNIAPSGDWQCIGQLEPTLRETLDLVAQRGEMTASDLARLLGLALNSASNRLKRLHDQHLVRREYRVSEKGFAYCFWVWNKEFVEA